LREHALTIEHELQGDLAEVFGMRRPIGNGGGEDGKVAGVLEDRGRAATRRQEANGAQAGGAGARQLCMQAGQGVQAASQGEEVGDEGGDEDGLAGAREAGDGEPDGGLVEDLVGGL
jgi:hypothetical protein